WRLFFTSHVRGEESFSYILGRTLMRPRELLRFVRDCINVAVNRRHEQVGEDDILHAERSYSDDALVDLSLELKDVRPDFANAPYGFIGSQTHLPTSEVGIGLLKAGIPADQLEQVRELLLWFGFLGIYVYPDEERYSYQFEHNLRKMKSGMDQFTYCVHPAFRQCLGCVTS
ncbi:MAG: P-loop ATPase, Sll1717 family, partial [Candidatus Acidiferrum sp.]